MRRWILGLVFGVVMGACGDDACAFNSECPRQHYCERNACQQDCREDFDCNAEESCNELGQCVGTDDGEDAGPDTAAPDTGPADTGSADTGSADTGSADSAPIDTGAADLDTSTPDTRGVDSSTDTGTDASIPGEYLDRCLEPDDCSSGRCVDDRGSTRFCSRSCASDSDCASEHVCAVGQCVPDDVGDICDEASDCALNLCAGNMMTGVGECTRRCSNATECPSGFACSDAGGAFVCVDIERPCARCPTGLCLGAQGCTSSCRSTADCPQALPGLEYTCTGGVCTPSDAVIGDDAIADMCVFTGDDSQCRSGLCLEDDSMRNVCTQACGESTGCGEGLACIPTEDGEGGIINVCQDVTTGLDLGEACASGPQCFSGICNGTCSRLCTRDRLCPTGLSCRAAAVGGYSTCEP